MKKKAEKYLEIALGGNMNIATLKPLALIEIMTDFANQEVKAINYTRFCNTFTAEEVVNELKENETLDDAISFYNNQKVFEMEKTIFDWAELFKEEITQGGGSESNVVQLLEDYKKEIQEQLSLTYVMPSACNYYVSGMDTNMNCINCKEPKHMH